MKALLRDVDGTLAETERDGHRVAFKRALPGRMVRAQIVHWPGG
jgi:phosphoglycolate phosphatase-like HAD superfamily hydrolase